MSFLIIFKANECDFFIRIPLFIALKVTTFFKTAAPVGPGCIYFLKHTVIVDVFLFIYILFVSVILYMNI